MRIQFVKIFKITLIYIVSSFCFISCNKQDDSPETKIYEYTEQVGKKIKELTDLLSNSQFGNSKDEYPDNSRTILEASIEDLKGLLEQIKSKELESYIVPFETERRLKLADSQILAFQETKRSSDVIVPAELHVNGKHGGFIDFGSSPEFSDFSNGATIEFWVKFKELSGHSFILANFRNEPHFSGWGANVFDSRFLRMTFTNYRENNSGYDLFEPWYQFQEVNSRLNRWIHVAYVWNPKHVHDGSSLGARHYKMYVNGDLVKEENWHNLNLVPHAEGLHLYGMNRPNNNDIGGATTDSGVNGYMKHMHLWKSVKSPAQIQTIMDHPETVTGQESDLICGWRFDEMPKGEGPISDLTGRFSASMGGEYKWEPKP